MKDLLNGEELPLQRANQASDEFVCLVASTRGLGDEIVDKLDELEPEFHDVLTDAARKAGLSPALFLAHVASQVKAGRYNDVQLLCMGSKIHHLLIPSWKPQSLVDFELELSRYVALAASV